MKQSVQYSAGDVVLVAFPFTSGGGKRRPALVLADTGDDDVLVAKITSSQAQAQYDIFL